MTNDTRSPSPLVVVCLVGLLLLPALACGSDTKPSAGAVQALGRVGPYTAGQPARVFVYTDG